MAKKKIEVGDIDELLGSFGPQFDGTSSKDDDSKYDTDEVVDPSEIDENPELKKKIVVDDPSKKKEEELEDIEGDEAESAKPKDKTLKIKRPIEGEKSSEEIDEEEKDNKILKEETEIDTVDLSDIEPEMAALFQEKLYEKLGITPEEDDEMKTVDDVVDYVHAMLEEYSQPVFANEEIEEINKFVENGGNLKNYFKSKYGTGVDIASVDLERESDQKAVVREYFKTVEKDYPDDKIEKRIQRYEDTNSLKEEAEEAHEWLKSFREKESKKQLIEQENLRKEAEKRQQKFTNDVISYIRSSKTINGIQLNNKEKEQLIKDIFIVDKEGKTNYIKRYEENAIKNLAESAFNTMFGDKYFKELSKKAESEAALKLKKKLELSRKTPQMKSSDSVDHSDSTALFDQLGSLLTGVK